MTRLVARQPRLLPRLAARDHSNGRGGQAGLPRGVIVLLGTACLVVVVAGLRGVSDLVGPVFLALMLAVTVSPLTEWMRRHRAPSWVAMTVTVLTVYLGLFALGGALLVSVSQLIDLLPQYQAQFTGIREDLVQGLGSFGIDAEQVRTAIAGADAGTVLDLVGSLFGGLASVLSDSIFLLAVLLFMCIDAVNFPARLRGTVSERPQVVGALRSFAQGTRRYLLVCTVFGLIVAVFDVALLWWLGIPLPLLWGLLSFITNYIPNIGFIIGVVPPALLGLLQGGPHLMLAVIALYCVVNFVIQSIIQPKIVGDAVGLSATVSFLSLIFWAWVLGALGALLAIPLTLLAKGLLVDIDPSTRWINDLLAGGPPGEKRTQSGRPRP
ncbi:putative PurR-regulated permease PerM [Actinoplanes campanulatus]|uniref:Putative PurR-regulated permease PerM n=1 Tax=Actinoplanes campanulatus TaxID=113559 RepID=A0A7W5ADU1_9ACTN|nr:AI-2E family transporter [Actinoplanes campanulatus]MBB3094498.1 putative PurR-regulated permease PerM [Actinoplanes campanulatus]GGN21480.1 AI-2E family transporter [Actinoplanes campanulatus]GID35587.1 AI-2E family transporter [Actinoplanes campanulatus]